MSSHFQNVNIQDLMAGPEEGPNEIVWTEEQKQEMNMRIAKSRLQYRKTQMKAQRGGQGRYELRKRQLEMKNNHVAQSTAGVKPNDRLDPSDLTDVRPVAVKEKSNNYAHQELMKQAPSKSKRKRLKRAQKAAAKKQAAAREAALERGETIEIPISKKSGSGESISLRLDNDELVIGGAAETISPTADLAKDETT